MPTVGDQYSLDHDGLWLEHVGPWAKQKHKILTDYIQICSATRNKYIHRAFLDPFSGPGKSRIRDTGELIDGSPVVAYNQGLKGTAFTNIFISDADADLLKSAETRLLERGAPVRAFDGPASAAVPSMVRALDPYGLHLAILDPHNLGTLSFDLFASLAKLSKIDIIVHVSISDLQRNVDLYSSEEQLQFDRFAPGWRDHVNTNNKNKESLRAAIIEYWTEKVVELGLPRAKHCELIRGSGNQRLYWLMLLAKHDLARSFWSKISSEAKSPGFDFG
jgi:three-Cys-motif partner protein